MKRIIDKSAWYFRKCTGCDLELEHDNGKFKCSRTNGCGRIIPYPDKRLHLLYLHFVSNFYLLLYQLLFRRV